MDGNLQSGQQRLYEFVTSLCRHAGEGEAFLREFWLALREDEETAQELAYYMDRGQFACQVSVRGYTVVDIMVWQIDHFKARLDRREDGMGDNGDKMLLMAFDTLLKMKKEPEKYVRLLQGETGTDYVDKY